NTGNVSSSSFYPWILSPLHAFDKHRNPLAPADAQRDQAEVLVLALHLVQDLGRDHGAGGSDGMAEGDRATVRVDLLAVEAQILYDRERLGRKRLVQLDHVDVVEGLPSAVERLPNGGHRPDPHDLRVDAAVRVGEDA